MTIIERALHDYLDTAITDGVRIQALSSALDDLAIKVAGFEVENNRMRQAIGDALEAMVKGDATAARKALVGVLR